MLESTTFCPRVSGSARKGSWGLPIRIDPDTRIAASPQNAKAGLLLRRARTSTDMSQQDFTTPLAKRLGLGALSQSALSDWERGNRQVPCAVVLAAAEVAHVNPADLFKAEEAREQRISRLTGELESLIGALTPAQQKRIKRVGNAR